VPGRSAIRQAILNDAPHGYRDDAVGVVTAGQGQIQHVGVEVKIAVLAVVLGIGHMQIAWPVVDRIAQFVQFALASPQSRRTPVAPGTALAGIIARTLDNLGFGKTFDVNDAFRGIGQIDSGWHGGSLLALATLTIGRERRNLKNCL